MYHMKPGLPDAYAVFMYYQHHWVARIMMSTMKHANQTTQQPSRKPPEKELAFRQWQSCIRLAWLQVELGGTFYIEQPQRCMSWQLKDQKHVIY